MFSYHGNIRQYYGKVAGANQAPPTTEAFEIIGATWLWSLFICHSVISGAVGILSSNQLGNLRTGCLLAVSKKLISLMDAVLTRFARHVASEGKCFNRVQPTFCSCCSKQSVDMGLYPTAIYKHHKAHGILRAVDKKK